MKNKKGQKIKKEKTKKEQKFEKKTSKIRTQKEKIKKDLFLKTRKSFEDRKSLPSVHVKSIFYTG